MNIPLPHNSPWPLNLQTTHPPNPPLASAGDAKRKQLILLHFNPRVRFRAALFSGFVGQHKKFSIILMRPFGCLWPRNTCIHFRGHPARTPRTYPAQHHHHPPTTHPTQTQHLRNTDATLAQHPRNNGTPKAPPAGLRTLGKEKKRRSRQKFLGTDMGMGNSYGRVWV